MSTRGGEFKVLDFGRPDHTGWGVYGRFPDGRLLLMSIEMNEDWKTQPFQIFYPRSRTHLWTYDLKSGRLTEIAHKQRLGPFYQPAAILPGGDRLLATVVLDGKEVLHQIELDGRNPRALTGKGEYVYGVALSPDGKRIAFHANYRIGVMNTDGSGRVEAAAAPGMLHFGPQWSPDGQWLCYQVCDSKNDPGHDWSDVWIVRPDGRGQRGLTSGYAAWFAASFGRRENPGSGSNVPRWSPDGREILFNRRTPGARPPWKYQVGRPDRDHFNRELLPEQATGGTWLCAVNPATGEQREVTAPGEGRWDFRGEWSADGKRILFCRAGVGENPGLWIVGRDGSGERMLTMGVNGQGADHPRWL